ncbi:MAG: peptidylprolyl isomerase [Nitrospirae bacterium]|nr:peptidylprolyl isomerase [Candidatus Manganitrophaceae bacterium]
MKSCFTNFLNRLLLPILTGMLLSTSVEAASAVLIDRVVAVVNREAITQSDLDEAAQALKKQGLRVGGAETEKKEVEHDLLNQMIEQKLLLQEAKKKGIRVTDSELDLALKDIEERNRFQNRDALKQAVSQEGIPWDKYMDDLRNQLTSLKLMNREVDSNLLMTEEEIKAYYDSHPEQFQLPEQIRVKQILLRVPSEASADAVERKHQKATEVLTELKSGTDFERLVEQYSEGAERRNGGDLGFFKKGDLAPEIDRVIFSLKDGEVSPVIQTSLGFHLFKVQVPPELRKQPFEKVKKEIEEKLHNEKRNALRQKWMNDIWGHSFVEVK